MLWCCFIFASSSSSIRTYGPHKLIFTNNGAPWRWGHMKMVSMSRIGWPLSITFPSMWPFMTIYNLRDRHFSQCHITADELVTPSDCTSSKMPCRAISSSFFLTLSFKCERIFLAFHNIWAGMNWTWALECKTESCLSSDSISDFFGQ